MYLDGVSPEAFVTLIEASLNSRYTDEQKALIQQFGKEPTFCFADPGTGKTFTAVGGLLFAELYKQIPATNIYAMSFTNLATGELAVRHERACEALHIKSRINFSTLTKLCRDILAANYRKLGMFDFNSTGKLSFGAAYRLIESTAQEWGMVLQPNSIRACIRACRSLNAALIFDEDNVKSKMAFKECHMDYKDFDRIRGLLYTYSLNTDSVEVSDIMLYTLMLMERFPEVSENFKAQCKMMLIDEAQDLSLLHLRIISMLTDCPVFIGDMKQQIYAFNGACQEIVEAFFRQWPNAATVKLTQSFRCADEIARFATKVILPNNIGGEDFKGVRDGGSVQLHHTENIDDTYNLSTICESLRQDYMNNKKLFSKDYLFLFRNNISAIPVVEELFKCNLPFRVNKYTPAYDIPVIKEMCEILMLCESPNSLDKISALQYLLPELRGYNDLQQNPLYKLCKESNCDIFTVNYQFRDHDVASDVMKLLSIVREKIKEGLSVGKLFNLIWPVYNAYYVEPNAWKLEADVKYYLRQIVPLQDKTFKQFIADEVAKVAQIEDAMMHKRGVRCYTMHASKGLEADVVYIIDADEGLIPNVSKLDKMLKKNCDMDAARALREERALCYVACTRAKDELHIVYTNTVSPILLGSEQYKQFDDVYQYYSVQGDDIKAFNKFCEEYVVL